MSQVIGGSARRRRARSRGGRGGRRDRARRAGRRPSRSPRRSRPPSRVADGGHPRRRQPAPATEAAGGALLQGAAPARTPAALLVRSRHAAHAGGAQGAAGHPARAGREGEAAPFPSTARSASASRPRRTGAKEPKNRAKIFFFFIKIKSRAERGRQQGASGDRHLGQGRKHDHRGIDISRRHGRPCQKIVHTSKSLHAHDENNEAHEGDLVRVIETRPLSRTNTGASTRSWSVHDDPD